MSAAASRRQSHGLTLPTLSDTRESVVTNILSSLATLDETAQLQWIQETSRQVDNERAYQRRENGDNRDRYDRYDEYGEEDDLMHVPINGVGYRNRQTNGSFNIIAASAPSPAVPMGRPSKQGFFRRFMGIGSKLPLESDLLISTQRPKYVANNASQIQIREIKEPTREPSRNFFQPNIPEESRPNIVKKKSSNFFRRRPKSAGDSANKSSAPFSSHEPLPTIPTILAPLPLPTRHHNLQTPMNDLRETIENYRLSNGAFSPEPPSPHPRTPSPMAHRHQYPELRIDDRELRLDSDGNETFEIYENGQITRLSSRTMFNVNDSNTRYVGRSPEPDKARQIMGLNPSKHRSNVRRKPKKHDDNTPALNPEYPDAITPQPIQLDVPTRNDVKEKGESMEEDRVKETARDIYNGTELLVALGDAARWLMSTDEFNCKVRTAYMELFDLMGLDILSSVRRLCVQLLLKGESQQLDRILESLAKRWYECNPENGMKDPDVVHAISYSIFLLNTDLHIVDIPSSQRMTRQQFVRNTMSTVLNQLPSAKRVSTEPVRSQVPINKGKLTTFPSVSSPNLPHLVSAPNLSRSGSFLRVGQAVGMIRNTSTQSLDHGPPRPSRESARTDGTVERSSWCLFDEKVGPFGGMASFGSQSAWEAQMECVLKDIYYSLKNTPLQQAQSAPSNEANTNTNLKPASVPLHRSASIVSQASYVSDSGSPKTRNTTKNGRDWIGRSKSQPRLPASSQEGSVMIGLDRKSMEERARSPQYGSHAKHARSSSHGRAPSVKSIESYNISPYENGPTIGFANSLTQTIIREEIQTSQASFFDEDIQEHALILSGPPWAKEGVLKSKRHLEANPKKSRDKGWTESFVVIDKGQMRLFQFDSQRMNSADRVGGGNWQQNANMIGSFLLRQTLASSLPSPGYSKQRPHVWALTLPSGDVFFFEAGTTELVKEWVESANYWAARTSKEPLKAGVSNMEWGWGDCLVLSDDEATDDETSAMDSHRSTFEAQRSPTSAGKMTYGGESRVLKGDKAIIREWKPPQSSLMGSSLKERDQLQALESFVKHLEGDFGQHNDIRPLMLRSFSPRHPNGARALANWERKSQYLLREIVKYKTYVEILSRALAMREKLIEASSNPKKTSPTKDVAQNLEPWFDLNQSAPNSVSTVNTKDAKGEKDDVIN